ncbi:MAG: hypothetical protein PHF89_01345 [Eubacteriales bacterium]|jgi:uncharacterized membrane protein YkvI|nr:hypothetical protein [Eubacteriales bacterium]
MSAKKVSALKAGAVYIGTVVGAGFATGQEILQFFANFGVKGLWGIGISTVLFICFGYIIMSIGFDRGARSHLEVIEGAGKAYVTGFMDVVITVFLFGSTAAMIAGTGALISEQVGLPSIWGSAFMALASAATVLFGIDGVVNSISVVVPFLLVCVAGVSGYYIIKMPPDLQAAESISKSGIISNWYTAAILYTSYNTIISVSVLGPLGAKIKSKKSILKGAVLGGMGLGLGSALIYFALLSCAKEISVLEVPMSFLASGISPVVRNVYGFVLMAEIYTTAIGSLYGFSARLADEKESPAKNKAVVVIAATAALIVSRWGFSSMVGIFYPLIGYGGIVLLVGLAKCVISKQPYRPRNQR